MNTPVLDPLTNLGRAILLALSVGVAPVTAAITGNDPGAQALPRVEVNDSAMGRLSEVEVSREDGTLILYGEVRTPTNSAQRAPGKVLIELLDTDGRTLEQVTTGYSRRSRKCRYGWFLVDLPAVPSGSPVVTVRVSHIPPAYGNA